MQRLFIDIETYSGEDLTSSGVYRYAESPDFRVLLIAYSIDGGAVGLIDLERGDAIPDEIRKAVFSPDVEKWSHNATFERVCLGHLFTGAPFPPEQWHCSMVQAATCGLPMSLDECGKALGIERQKMTEGRALIRSFCRPRPDGNRNLPEDHPEKWETFRQYCIRDVEAEIDIFRQTEWNRPTDRERGLYILDQRINDRGVMIDRTLVSRAVRMDAIYKARLNVRAKMLTGLENPNSVAQLKVWLKEKTGKDVTSLNKADMPGLLQDVSDSVVSEVLEIRAEMGRTSPKKYQAMLDTVCNDGRIRGLTQFYGAARTGRWAGRLVQLQNLPRNSMNDLDFARQVVLDDDLDLLELCYGNVPDVLSQLVRTAFIAPEGKTFAVCDFSAIEARVIAWLAGEEWVLEVFRSHGKIYEATAARMYRCSIDEITKTDPRRQKGKIAVLALGYGGGVAALEAMGGERMGLSEDEMSGIVMQWRSSNPGIVELWSEVQTAAMKAVRSRQTVRTHGLEFSMHGDDMTVRLPSGRLLVYPSMKTVTNRFGGAGLSYLGVNQTTRKWSRCETYGGKLTENIVQAIARDCLAEALARTEAAGIPVVFHVHDELICEVDGESRLDELKEIFRTPPDWAPGLPLKGDGYCTPYYKKD